MLTGRTYRDVGGPLAKSFVGVVTLFHEEKIERVAWKKKNSFNWYRKKAKHQREKAIALLGGRCAKCSSEKKLQFDHIDPATKSFNVGQHIAGAWSRIETELKKCQLLCYSCHKAQNQKPPSSSPKAKDHVWRSAYMQEYLKKRAEEHSQRALDLLGSQCVKCSATENLQFDHIDPSTKSFNIGNQITSSWSRIEQELKKCQLLCYTCHKVKSGQETKALNPVLFSGERSSKAKLTNSQAAAYRQRFKDGELNMHDIAAETNMSTKNVRMMLRGLTYRKADGPLATAEEAINYITPDRKERYREDVVLLFKSGVIRLSDICKEVAVSSHTAKSYLIDAGLLSKDQSLLDNKNPHAKLTPEQVQEYRERFSRGELTMTAIAEEVGMSITGVSRFLKGTSYREAGGPLL